MNQYLLDVSNLCMRLGGLLAVDQMALTVNEGEIVSMIGPNGAGKTTVFNCLTGFYRPPVDRFCSGNRLLRSYPASRSPASG